MNYNRDYTCTKKFEHNYIVCIPNIMYLSERDSYELYKIIKVPLVEAHGIDSLIFGTSVYDRMYIREIFKGIKIKFK
jgi:hypothetical protein